MGVPRGPHWGKGSCVQISDRNMLERGHMEDLPIVGSIILKCILTKYFWRRGTDSFGLE